MREMNGGNEYVERITVCHNVNHLFLELWCTLDFILENMLRM